MSRASLHFTYVTAHSDSPSFPSLHLRHKLLLQPFSRFTYVTNHSPTLPLLHLRHSSFSIPSFASSTSQALHLIHLASRPWQSLFRRFSYVTSQMSRAPSVVLTTSHHILQPLRRVVLPYDTGTSPKSPSKPPMSDRLVNV